MKALFMGALLLVPAISIAFFGGPYAAVNQAAATVVMHESINVKSQDGQSGTEVQKFYDYDERVICYVYVGMGISCVNDQSN